jgi:hypothetical protein
VGIVVARDASEVVVAAGPGATLEAVAAAVVLGESPVVTVGPVGATSIVGLPHAARATMNKVGRSRDRNRSG